MVLTTNPKAFYWVSWCNLVSMLLVERIRFGYFVLAGFKKHTGPFVLEQKGAALALLHHRQRVSLLQALLLTCSSLEIAKIKGAFCPKSRFLSLLPVKRNAGLYYRTCTSFSKVLHLVSCRTSGCLLAYHTAWLFGAGILILKAHWYQRKTLFS